MPIWVDADACPVPIREILCRAATRWQGDTTFIANHAINQMETGDLVITQDIPLAAEAIEKGADVFNPRGQAFTKENIRQRLAMRNFMEEMRNAGQVTGGPAPFSQTDRKEFADKLDRWLQQNASR